LANKKSLKMGAELDLEDSNTKAVLNSMQAQSLAQDTMLALTDGSGPHPKPSPGPPKPKKEKEPWDLAKAEIVKLANKVKASTRTLGGVFIELDAHEMDSDTRKIYDMSAKRYQSQLKAARLTVHSPSYHSSRL
jgi:hypothetical protein